MQLRRLSTVAVATVASLAVAAGPASAHFCFKTALNERAASGVAGSNGWATFEELAFQFTGLCPEGIQVLAAAAGVPKETLINAHGVMAGGLVKQGKSNKAISHLDFEAIGAAEEAAQAACP